MQWAWEQHTPNGASLGCSSPPNPTALVRYLQNGKLHVRMTFSTITMSLLLTEVGYFETFKTYTFLTLLLLKWTMETVQLSPEVVCS